jgi:hypothetical protein
MTRTVTARLTTLCGARQYVCMDGPAPPMHTVMLGTVYPNGYPNGIPAYRQFRLVSLMPTDAAVDAEYEEVFE